MKTSLQFRPVATTLFVVLGVSCVLYVASDWLIGWTMYEAWAPLLPGFAWQVTAAGFLIGWLWIVSYSMYGVALTVFPCKYLLYRQTG